MKVSFFFGKGYRILISVLTFLFLSLLIFIHNAYVQPPPPPPPPPTTPYTTSAHGSAHGVNRTSLTAPINFGYSVGNCAHCHEQHASIGGSEPAPSAGSPSPYAIFADNFTSQSDDFCLYCHKGAGSLQVSFDRINYNYSYWFGGDHVNHTSPNNIYDAFNPAIGSSHNLDDILTFVKSKWPGTFNDESNPCNACHNPHLSKRSYPIVRPTDRNNIWGDSAGEHMSDYAAAHGGQYQAPYWYGSTSSYEPDNSTTTDGSNLPDYVTFCSDCHNATDVIWSTTLGRNLRQIDWTQQNKRVFPGDYHGSVTRCKDVDGTAGRGAIKDPYYTAAPPPTINNFILSCTDCHEPHGAVAGRSIHGTINNVPYMLRKTVNGYYNGYVPGGPGGPDIPWEKFFCDSCHNNWAMHCGYGCLPCHFHNAASKCWGAWECGGGGGAAGNSF